MAWKRRRRSLLLVALLTILLGGLSSCATSGGGVTIPRNGGSGVTPAGSYSIPVTISADGVSQTVTLTLTVD
jgi:hypothetical protein